MTHSDLTTTSTSMAASSFSGLSLVNLDHTELLVIHAAEPVRSDTFELWVDGQFIRVLDNHAVSVPVDVLEDLNQIANPGFDQGLESWVLRDTNPEFFTLSTDFSDEWTLKGGHTAYIYQKGNKAQEAKLTYHDPVEGEYLRVRPGGYYRVMGYFGFHRCVADMLLEFFDNRNSLIKTERIPLSSDALGGITLDAYLAVNQIVTTPATAHKVRLTLVKQPTQPGREHSFLFFTHLYWGLSSPRAGDAFCWKGYLNEPALISKLRSLSLDHHTMIRLALPDQIYDGAHHQIAVRYRESGQDVEGSPLTFQYSNSVSGEIEKLEGSVVCGWARLDRTVGIPLQVGLWIDNVLVAAGICNIPHVIGSFGFRLPIPVEYLDGRPHHLAIRAHLSGNLIGATAEILPYALTPWEALHSNTGLLTATVSSPAASYRYQSLLKALKAVGEHELIDPEHVAIWRKRRDDLSRLHDLLVIGFEKNKNFQPLEFPYYECPKVSIIIPVHNKFAVTYNCLAALLFAYNQASFEVILVDDGSQDGTQNITSLVSGLIYVRNPVSKGFIEACNLGAEPARGEYVVFLNNDTEPTVSWLDEMLYVFDHFDQVGLVGAKLIYADGRLQEAGGIVWKTGDPWNYGRGGNAHDPRYNYTRQVDYLSGAAIMLPRSVWESVGGFSEEYKPAYFEDTDLAFKVRATGLKTVYAPHSVVYHFEGLSSGTDVNSGTKKYQEINRPKFKQKWVQACRDNGELGHQVELNKDRGVFYRALVIDYQMPRPDRDAGSYAAIQEMRLLQAMGFKVTFLAENLAYLGEYNQQLQRMGVEVIHAPFVSSIATFLETRGKEVDLVYITRYYVAKNHINAVRQFAPQAKVLFCNADLHFLREMRVAIQAGNNELMKRAEICREEELSVMKEVDVVLSYNMTEHAVIQSHNGLDTRLALCPWVVDVAEFTPLFALRKDIAFIGGFGHPPNQEAVQFFVREIMPALIKQLPEVRFIIYGSQIPPAIEALQSSHVIIAGQIPKVSQVFETCRVFVAPLQSGAGVKGKVMDALSYGVPSVLSPLAAEGINIRNGVEALIAETPDEWVSAIVELYQNHLLWQTISEQARQFIQEHHSFERGKFLMRKALQQAGIYPPQTVETLVFNKARIN